MRKAIFILSAASLLASPALAESQGKGKALGHEPKVCLLTFASAAERGTDAGVVKAQYVPLSIGTKLRKDTATQGVAYYGFGELTPEQRGMVDFYYPTGSFSNVVGVPDNSDTQTLCSAFMTYAESRDDDAH